MAAGEEEKEPSPRYFTVFYAKNSNKKHKNWMDGVITIKGRHVELKDMEAKSLAQRLLPFSTDVIGPGSAGRLLSPFPLFSIRI